MAADFKITSTQPYHYQDETMRVVDGYRVFFFLPAYDETHYVLVPSLNPETVKKAIAAVLADRKNLATI
jgi:hypothetical protein